VAEFTPLERAALQEICRLFSADRAALEAQLATAKVIERENSGAGFFTSFDVSHDSAPVSGDRMRSGGWARVDGFRQPVGFILWLEDGYAARLEGFTIDDSTVGVDLTALTFQILPPETLIPLVREV
jgi:hypothetical protein